MSLVDTAGGFVRAAGRFDILGGLLFAGDQVCGGSRAGAGMWCPGSPPSSGPMVATGGGAVSSWPVPVIRCVVGPRPPTSSGPRATTAGRQVGDPVLQVANAGDRAGDPVLQVAPGRRRAQGPGWPLPVAGRVNRCCRWPPGRCRDLVPRAAAELDTQGGHCRPPGG